MIMAAIAALIGAAAAGRAPAASPGQFSRAFTAADAGEAVATIRAGCARCDWGETGREAAVLRLSLDGRYSQHLVLTRGETAADYRVALGPVTKGAHRLTIDRDARLSAAGAGRAAIEAAEIAVVTPGDDEFTALSMAPIVYARPNTVGKFTDVPLLMWYEIEKTPRGRQYRYSVIFSNEDGGTKTDRLMATWGRTTDIEFVYGAELDEAGRVLAEEFQGPGHEVPAFKGRHEGRHPLQWVSTDNNMVSESGPTRIRYAPAPAKFDLAVEAREAVMDANPWSYAVASVEMRREGKIADDPPPGINKIPDPRRFVFVEACGTVGNAALAISVGSRQSSVFSRQSAVSSRQSAVSSRQSAVSSRQSAVSSQQSSASSQQSSADLTWTPSDRGQTQYRIVRDGCFTIATPLPAGTRPPDIRAIRIHAFDRPPAAGGGPAAHGVVNVTRINKVFMLDEAYLPGRSLLHWEGSAAVPAGGAPYEVKIP